MLELFLLYMKKFGVITLCRHCNGAGKFRR